jgi:hypothetical protein
VPVSMSTDPCALFYLDAAQLELHNHVTDNKALLEDSRGANATAAYCAHSRWGHTNMQHNVMLTLSSSCKALSMAATLT